MTQRVRIPALYLEQLVARRLAAHDPHATRRNAKALGNEPAHGGVRAAVHGRGLHADQEGAIALAGDLVAARARLDPDCDSAHARSLGRRVWQAAVGEARPVPVEEQACYRLAPDEVIANLFGGGGADAAD